MLYSRRSVLDHEKCDLESVRFNCECCRSNFGHGWSFGSLGLCSFLFSHLFQLFGTDCLGLGPKFLKQGSMCPDFSRSFERGQQYSAEAQLAHSRPSNTSGPRLTSLAQIDTQNLGDLMAEVP